MTPQTPVLIAVTRIRNDDDIVEAFVRHHAGLVDHHLLLDDGSTDLTPSILAALKAEGLGLSVFRDECPWFDECRRNTFLLREAAALGADWVLFLDCDEFVDAAALPAPLRELLADVPDHMAGVTAELVAYSPTAGDDAAEIVVPLRVRHRAPEGSGVRKVFARASVVGAEVGVVAGNHGLEQHGRPVVTPPYPSLFLAHYPMRTGWQMLAKAAVGRLKVLASGASEVARGSSSHYTELLDHLIHRPEWVTDPLFLEGRPAPDAALVERPLRYLGGKLAHTRPHDPRLTAVRSVLAYAETLARSHGALRDAAVPAASPGAILQVL